MLIGSLFLKMMLLNPWQPHTKQWACVKALTSPPRCLPHHGENYAQVYAPELRKQKITSEEPHATRVTGAHLAVIQFASGSERAVCDCLSATRPSARLAQWTELQDGSRQTNPSNFNKIHFKPTRQHNRHVQPKRPVPP
uniref:Secreted protein n=1 Tax=Knipowitschia caucasica TaxID=637954 RepID=A0AAV2LCJ9_KNICA